MSMPQGRATIMADVARLAGVSHQTVSRVLNHHPYVRTETRRRVLEAVDILDYRPNAMARGLAGRRSRLIGVISLATMHYGPAATRLGIERAARAESYGVRIASLDQLDSAALTAAVEALADQSVAGVVVVAPQVASAAMRRLPSSVAAVAVEADAGGRIPTIAVDQAAGARMAVEHLLRLGHRQVWHVSGPPGWVEARGRIEGWRAALAEAGLAAPKIWTGDWTAAAGYAAGLELGARGDVTAVFAGNDQMALGLLCAFNEQGIRVPGDVSVVGFDDIPEAAYLSTPLTTVRQDFDEVGRRCIATLLHHVSTGPHAAVLAAADPSRIVPTLVVRDSTAGPGGTGTTQ
jgi:LacI family transcriptional regulator